jgi:hypothetical protein
MSKCNNCNCICHCGLKEHSDMYGVCSCTACACGDKESEQTKAEQSTYESNGAVVVDNTGDCESCG